MIDQTELISRLTAGSPETRALMAEHIDTFGEVIPHVFLGEVSRFLEELDDQTRAGNREAESLLMSVLSILETGFRDGNEDVQNMIGVSFLENVMERAIASPAFRLRLGPLLRKDLQVMLGAYGYDIPDEHK